MSEKNLTKIVDDDKKSTYTLSSLLSLLSIIGISTSSSSIALAYPSTSLLCPYNVSKSFKLA